MGAGVGAGGHKGTAMHRVRDRVGLNASPLVLRLMLGIIFLWAGLWKVSIMTEVQGEEAAILAQMGIITKPAAGVPAPTTPAAPSAAPAAPKSGGRTDAGAGAGRMVLVKGGGPTAEDF